MDVDVQLPGVGELCRPGVRLQGRTQPSGFPPIFQRAGAGTTVRGVEETTKFTPTFRVFEMGPEDGVVLSLRVEETLGYEIPACRIVMDNSGCPARFQSAAFTREQLPFEVMLGFKDVGLVNHGKYFVQRPKFTFSGETASRIEVIGYSEAMLLGATERREFYRKIRDSEIAQRIAERYGLEADVDETDPVHDQVIQANESDFQFLAKRAKLHGFITSVSDGVLRFQAPRPCESGLRIICGGPQETGVSHASIRSRTFQRGARFRMAQVDPVTGEEFEVVSSGSQTELERSLRSPRRPADITSVPGVGRVERFITNVGHEQRRNELQRQVDRMGEANRFVVAGTVETVGLPDIVPNTIVTLEGIGRSSGKYFVTRATHTIDKANGYRTQLDVVRTSNDEVVAGQSEALLESAGTVAL